MVAEIDGSPPWNAHTMYALGSGKKDNHVNHEQEDCHNYHNMCLPHLKMLVQSGVQCHLHRHHWPFFFLSASAVLASENNGKKVVYTCVPIFMYMVRSLLYNHLCVDCA